MSLNGPALLFAALLFCILGCHATNPTILAAEPWCGLETRRLRAARVKSDLQSRSIDGSLAHDLDLHYLDERSHESPQQFSARVLIASHLPAIVLEDIDHHFSEIKCTESSICLYFDTLEMMDLAYEEFTKTREFMVITAHEGCNNDGERIPFRVSNVEFIENETLIVLSTSKSTWQDAAHSMTLHFGQNNDDFVIQRHGGLRSRQDSASSTVSASASTTGLSTISYPVPSVPTVSATSLGFDITDDISWRKQDTIIMGEGSDLGTITVNGPAFPADFITKCVDCSVTGKLELLSGSLTMSTVNESSNTTDNIISFYEHGFVEFRADHFTAHIELETSITESHSLGNPYTVTLPPIPITPFQIPGIAIVGPEVSPVFSMGLSLSTELDFSYGFDVSVPDGSTIVLDINDIANSSVTGFSDSTVTALPFNAHVADISVTLAAGFKPVLLLGLSVFDNVGYIGAGVFLNLPTISATVSQVDKVNTDCTPVTNSTSTNGVLNDILGSYTHVVPTVEFDFGFQLEAKLSDDGWGIEDENIYNELSTVLPLPTKCLGFDKTASTYAPASVIASASASASASGSAAKSGNAPRTINVVQSISWAILVMAITVSSF